MNGDIAQWFGLSFQRPIQGSMTLFFELSIFAFVILFFALILFFFFNHYYWNTAISLASKVATFWPMIAQPPLKRPFQMFIFGEKNVNQNCWGGELRD